MPPQLRRQLMSAALLDGACIIGGVAGFLATGNWLFLAGGILLGAGFLLPALIAVIRSRK